MTSLGHNELNMCIIIITNIGIFLYDMGFSHQDFQVKTFSVLGIFTTEIKNISTFDDLNDIGYRNGELDVKWVSLFASFCFYQFLSNFICVIL